MYRNAPTAPVFLLGPPRSGAALLGCCLEQHPAFDVLTSGEWIARLSMQLQAAYDRDATHPARSRFRITGVDRTRMLRIYGAVTNLLVATDRRWVDCCTENVHHVHGLTGLFPDARFVHVVRDPDGGHDALAAGKAPDSGYFTAESAATTWLAAVRAGLLAERALGPGGVLRILHRDLTDRPEDTIRRCLEFLGEPFEPACLRPLAGMAAGRRVRGDGDGPRPSAARAEARAVYHRILEEERASKPSGAAARELAEEFTYRARTVSVDLPEGSSVGRMRNLIRGTVPPGGVALIVSRGDDELLELERRTAWHFPRTEDGRYAGHHPADSSSAIRHLECLRAEGAEFLVFPCTAYWWLEHYRGFGRHLEQRYRVAAYLDDVCLIYALQDPTGNPSPRLLLATSDFAGPNPGSAVITGTGARERPIGPLSLDDAP